MPRRPLSALLPFFKPLATLLCVLLLLLPGSKAAPFDGLPLEGWEALAVLVTLLAVWATAWQRHSLIRLAVLGGLFVSVLLQPLGALLVPYGWSVCLRRDPAAATVALATPCEPSAEFIDGSRTLVTRKLDYAGRSFPLSFMNSGGMNFYTNDQPNREALPYHFAASTYLYARRDAELRLSSTFADVQVSLDGRQVQAPANQELRLPLPADKLVRVEISYSAARSNLDHFTVRLQNARPYLRETAVPLLALRFYQAARVLFLAVAFFALGYASWLGFRAFTPLTRRRIGLGLAVVALAAWVGRSPGQAETSFLLANAALLVIFFGWENDSHRQERGVWAWLIGLACLNAFLFVSRMVPPDYLILFAGGNDELGHEAVARFVLFAPDWHSRLLGTEAIFYYQPLYRYIEPLFHWFLGDTMWGPYLAQTWLMAIAVLTTARLISRLAGSVAVRVFAVLSTLYFLALPGLSVFRVVETGFQQALGVPALLLALSLTLYLMVERDERPWAHLGAGLIYGLALATRSDYAPTLISVLVYLLSLYFWYRRNLRRGLLLGGNFLAGFLFFPLLVILHNQVFGHMAMFFPTSTLINIQEPFRPLFPGWREPSTLSGGQIALRILSAYRHDLHGLAEILYGVVVRLFIGTEPLRSTLWRFLPLVSIGLFFVRGWREKLGALLFPAMLGLLVLAGSFFDVHNGGAMLAHLDYLVLVAMSICLGILFSAAKRA